jgi:hypothetical protein
MPIKEKEFEILNGSALNNIGSGLSRANYFSFFGVYVIDIHKLLVLLYLAGNVNAMKTKGMKRQFGLTIYCYHVLC